jgi:uncharacterized OB-fold protein
MLSRVVTVSPDQVKIGMPVAARITDGLIEFTPA